MSVATERKLVTVLFCDLVGSTALGERLDAEAVQIVQAAYFDRMRAVVEQFGGTVEKFAGDAVVAVFGVPAQHEDDAERAVRCALGMREALVGLSDTVRPRFGVELELRIGIATGEAVVGGADALATGDVMNTAARLEQAAEPGQILVGRDTKLLTAYAVDYAHELAVSAKGKSEPVRAWAALRPAASPGRARSPLVGRGPELEHLAAALERAIALPQPQTVIVLGAPGIGKSRLAEEFAQRASGRARVFHGACAPYGEGSVWQALAAVVRQEAGIHDGDDEDDARTRLHLVLEARHEPDELPLVEALLASLVGASTRALGSEQELRWAVRRWAEELAAARPAVVVLDDLHWADDALLDTVAELVGTVAPVPLTLVLQGRPELAERVAGLTAQRRTSVVRLGELSADAATALVDNLAQGAEWTSELRAAIVERGEGSPLFLEEVAAMAAEDGIDAGVPRSLRALIGARLDLFPADVKRVAQAAAVVGDVFWDGALPESDVLPAIGRLRAAGFIDDVDGSMFAGLRQYRFHHAVIREVAYGSLPKLERAELHRHAARWLGLHAGRPELVLATARHLERAVSLRREVAPFEIVDPELARAAVDALRAAATWAAANAGVRQPIELLRSAVDVAGGDAPLADAAEAQLAAMLARSGAGAEAVELAERVLADPATSEGAALAWLAVAEAARGRFDPRAMSAAATRAIELARELGLRDVEFDALDIAGLAASAEGRMSSSVEYRRLAAEIAREQGDLARVAWSLGGHSAISLMELGRLDEAEAQASEALRLATGAGSLRSLEAAHAALSMIRRAQDRFEDSLEHGRERVALAEGLGEAIWLYNGLTVNVAGALIALDRLDEALSCVDLALGVARRSSVPEDYARALRVEIFVRQGRIEDAEAELASIDNTLAFFGLSELRVSQGRIEDADEVWQRAIAKEVASEGRLTRAEIFAEYAAFLATAGRADDARASIAKSHALVDGTGAALVQRLIREAEALL